jgi:hypothetical protein
MASANGRDPHELQPNDTDEIAERLKRGTEARVQESRRLIELAKRTLTGSLSLLERHD